MLRRNGTEAGQDAGAKELVVIVVLVCNLSNTGGGPITGKIKKC